MKRKLVSHSCKVDQEVKAALTQGSFPSGLSLTLSMVEGSSPKTWRAPMKNCFSNRMMHYVYILCCADGSFYVGSTHNLQARLKAHNNGRGAAYTFKHGPVRLVYSETFQSEPDALKRERQLKHWSRGKKEALISNNFKGLKHLSKRRS